MECEDYDKCKSYLADDDQVPFEQSDVAFSDQVQQRIEHAAKLREFYTKNYCSQKNTIKHQKQQID